MPTVIIDGITYAPTQSGTTQFGVAVSTRNRHAVLSETLASIDKYTPPGTPVIVVDDGSDQPVDNLGDGITLIRHEAPQGIPATKNRCIDELMSRGVQHLFLFDDDTRPASDNWWQPYIESSEHHLQYCWQHFSNGQPVPNMEVLHQDSHITAYGWSMGCMLYLSREAVNRCGGMRFEFGLGMEEHADLSRRIFNAGLTSHVYQDITGSAGLFHADDETLTAKRTFDSKDRADLLERNRAIRIAHHHDDGYVEYRLPEDTVLSCYFNAVPDPQRDNKIHPSDPKLIAPLQKTVAELAPSATHVVFTDCLPEGHRTECVHSAYRQRWHTYYSWMRENPQLRNIWCVDATDVLMLNNPFTGMQPGTLYIGWEPKTVGTQWLRDNGSDINGWIDDNAHRTLLNVGVVGGDRATMLEFVRRMLDLWYELRSTDIHEMAFANHVAYQHFSDRLVTGPQVTTVFRSNAKASDESWWSHK